MTKQDLYYKGKSFETLDGFLHEIATDMSLDEAQLAHLAEECKQAGMSTKDITNPEVLTSMVKHVDEQKYAVDPQDVTDVCNVDCARRSHRSRRTRESAPDESNQDIIRFEEDDLTALITDYLRRR